MENYYYSDGYLYKCQSPVFKVKIYFEDIYKIAKQQEYGIRGIGNEYKLLEVNAGLELNVYSGQLILLPYLNSLDWKIDIDKSCVYAKNKLSKITIPRIAKRIDNRTMYHTYEYFRIYKKLNKNQ